MDIRLICKLNKYVTERKNNVVIIFITGLKPDPFWNIPNIGAKTFVTFQKSNSPIYAGKFCCYISPGILVYIYLYGIL